MKNFLVPQDANLREAALALSKNKSRTVFIVDKNEVLLGVFTEGDLARAFLKGVHPDISNVMEFASLTPYAIKADRLKATDFTDLFLETGHLTFPIIGEEGRILDVVEVRKELKRKSHK